MLDVRHIAEPRSTRFELAEQLHIGQCTIPQAKRLPLVPLGAAFSMNEIQSAPAPNTGIWCTQANLVCLRVQGQADLVPSAAEVYGVEFQNKSQVRSITVQGRPSDILPGIRFSKHPLDFRLIVIPPSADGRQPPRCRIEAANARKVLEFQTIALASPDHLLSGSEWFPISTETRDDVQALLLRLGVAGTGSLTLKQYLDIRRENPASVAFLDDHVESREESQPAPSSTQPPGFALKLYPYQSDGFRWLCRVADEGLGCILGDEMGLGKTCQVIGLLASEKEAERGPSIVVAPATVLENWRREIARFAPSLVARIHRGSDRAAFPSELRDVDVLLTSYETALRDLTILRLVAWNVAVLDEAQAIKNPFAQRTTALKQLPRRVALAVTGTPLENRLMDVWSIMDFSFPGYLGSRADFEVRYTNVTHDAALLEPLLSPLMLRRRVRDVARDLPERIDIPTAVPLGSEAALEYEEVRRQAIEQYGANAALVALTKLRMFCTHPFLINQQEGDPALHSTKYARLIEILEEIAERGEKALVFTSYQEMIDILLRDLPRRMGLPCRMLDGRVPVEKRQQIIDDFGAIDGPALLALNPKAGGTGVNITAANHVIHFNLEWNPAVEDQASARAYRHGQLLPVTVHRLFHPQTVEEVIDGRVTLKRQLAAHAIVGTSGTDDDSADIRKALRISPVGSAS